MPYCFIELQPNGKKKAYLPVNRNYKPLGIASKEWVDYEKFRNQAVIFRSDPKTFRGIWNTVYAGDGDGHCDMLYLYEDAHTSRTDYFERLEKLALQNMKLVGPSEVV
jgi:hypothetical protein